MKLFYKPGCPTCQKTTCALLNSGANVEFWNVDSVDGMAEFADASVDIPSMPVLVGDDGAQYAGSAAVEMAEWLLHIDGGPTRGE